MEYVYDLFVNGVRKETHDRFEKAENAYLELCDQEPLATISFEITGANGYHSYGESYTELEAERQQYEYANTLKEPEDFFDQYALKHSGLDGYVAHKDFNCTAVTMTKDMIEQTPPFKDAINPSHYKDVVPGYQYAEMMVYMLANQTGVNSHLLGQVYKYLMRNGKKDEEVQELKKAQWYLNALINYKEQGKVIV